MPDENNNGIPDRIDKAIGGLLLLAASLFSAFQLATDYQWAAWVPGVQAMLPILGGYFSLRGRPKSAGPAVGLLALVLVAGCGGPYAVAWRTTSAVRSAGTLTDKAVATAVRAEATKCIKAKSLDVPKCVRATKAWAAHEDWRKYGVPAVNSAIVATVTALQIAEQTKQDKLDWMAALKPAACALAKIVEQWGAHLGSAKTAVLGAVGALKGVTCK